MTTRLELLAHLAARADRGHVAPCLRWPDAGWTADDHGEQRTAARLCLACPALAPCRAYGTANPLEFGCYGGLIDVERHQPTRRATSKESLT